MKKTNLLIFIITLFYSITVFAYDYVVKDKYGKVTGYMDKQGDRTYMIDKYGRRGDYIESDGTIKDKFGRKKGKINKKD